MRYGISELVGALSVCQLVGSDGDLHSIRVACPENVSIVVLVLVFVPVVLSTTVINPFE